MDTTCGGPIYPGRFHLNCTDMSRHLEPHIKYFIISNEPVARSNWTTDNARGSSLCIGKIPSKGIAHFFLPGSCAEEIARNLPTHWRKISANRRFAIPRAQLCFKCRKVFSKSLISLKLSDDGHMGADGEHGLRKSSCSNHDWRYGIHLRQ
jgi:hypothetical protein